MSTATFQWTQTEIDQFVARAQQIYRDTLASVLEREHGGEIVAIAPGTGNYFLGADEIAAHDCAQAAGEDGPFYFLRIGSDYTHRWMTP